MDNNIITLAHGSGGKMTHRLISELFYKYFNNPDLNAGGDSAILALQQPVGGKLAFTTDSYVITPRFFRGGNIGKLAVCGTVNDLTVSGAHPLYLSCGMILEEGLAIEELETIVASMAKTAEEAGVKIVTGDTKVVQKGAADGIFINTAGIGMVPEGIEIASSRIQAGDKVLVTGTLGDHGTAILLEREGFPISVNLESDCAPLNRMLSEVALQLRENLRVMRDPTRGGLATTLNELALEGNCGIHLVEEAVPVRGEVTGVCEMLGLDPFYMANEGKAILIVAPDRAEDALKTLLSFPYGANAALIGEVTAQDPGMVYLETVTGGSRILDMLTGDQLPRIC